MKKLLTTASFIMAVTPATVCRCDTIPDDMPEVLFSLPAKKPEISVKTNALPWAATIMNAGVEIRASRRISFSIPLWWCPWFIAKRHALRVLAFQPEARWWFSGKPNGHFLGPHLSLAWFNLRNGMIRYQDSGLPLLGAGITYGYRLDLKNGWAIEASAGAGWIKLRYDRFHNVANGARIDTRRTSYWGIDHASLSIVYTFRP